jgi:outer membrane immunogenic protein
MTLKEILRMRMTLRTLLLTGVVTVTAVLNGQTQSLHASSHEVDLALTYDAVHNTVNGGGSFWQQGGGVELSAEFYHGLGIAASVGGVHVGNIHGSGVDLTTITTVFGPRYTWTTPSGRIALFGQGLIGEAHGLGGVFPSTVGVLSNYNTFALQAGGGVDWRLSRHYAARLIQADWLRTEFPNAGANVQNNLRLGAGIVFRLQR